LPYKFHCLPPRSTSQPIDADIYLISISNSIKVSLVQFKVNLSKKNLAHVKKCSSYSSYILERIFFISIYKKRVKSHVFLSRLTKKNVLFNIFIEFFFFPSIVYIIITNTEQKIKINLLTLLFKRNQNKNETLSMIMYEA
jgi:hypothetical protein